MSGQFDAGLVLWVDQLRGASALHIVKLCLAVQADNHINSVIDAFRGCGGSASTLDFQETATTLREGFCMRCSRSEPNGACLPRWLISLVVNQ